MHHRIASTLLAALALTGPTSTAWAAIVTWTDTSGGAFVDGANWDTGAAPGWLDTAKFDSPGATFTVTFDDDEYIDHATFEDGDVTLDLGGFRIENVDQGLSTNVGDGTLRLVDGYYKSYADVDVGDVGNGTLLVEHAAATFEAGWYLGGTLQVGGWSSTGVVGVSSGGRVISPLLDIRSTGTLQGDGGFVEAVVENSGTIDPGWTGVGTLTIEGTLEQEPDGVVVADLGGTLAGDYDVLAVTGQVDLGGTLDVNLYLGHTPSPGDTYTILTGGTINGTFDTLDLPALGADEEWQVTYGPTSVVLSLEDAPTAEGSLLGTDVELFAYSDLCGVIGATVADPDVEFPGVGPELCFAGDTPRLDSDVSAETWRIDFLVEQDFGCSGGPTDWFTLRNLNPVCDDGSLGTVTGVGEVRTNMETDEWVVSQVRTGDHEVVFECDATALGGDDPNHVRTHPGDFIEAQIEFSCGGPSMTMTGECPGVVTIDMKGFTPSGTIAVLKGGAPGSAVLPAGPCIGTTTGLSSLTLVTTFNANAAGGKTVTPSLNELACGSWLQMLDVATCALSPAAIIPSGGAIP